VKTAVVKGMNAAQESVFEQKLPGWYVLAGDTREFETEIPAGDCPHVRTLLIEAQHDQGTLTAHFDVPSAACNP